MKLIRNFIGHYNTVREHRRLVREYCFKAGLYRQGIMHDLSKYSPTEFLVGVKYYQGNRSPNNAEREATGVTKAWLHHKGRNKHHLEYWIDYSLGEGHEMCGMPMPPKYVVEMFCDRIAACKVYQKDAYTDASPWKYYEKGKDHYMIHSSTKALLEKLLRMLMARGEDYTFDYIRRKILKNVIVLKIKINISK